MTGASVLAAGAILGVEHALEADHLAAVGALVDDEGDGPGRVGASWGLGHSLPIVVLGLGVVALGVRPPASLTPLFEALVGAVLLVLGSRLVWAVVGARCWLTARHRHDDESRPHAHLPVGDVALGATHVHLHGESFLVGVLHGFAGSGALVVLLVAATPSAGAALGFLAAFCGLSIATMAAVSAIWGRALGTAVPRYLETGAGLLAVVVGASLLVEGAAVLGPV